MAKILLGWEYGAGLGHIGKLVTLAGTLRAAGHEPVIALTQMASTRQVWENSGIEVIGGPYIKAPPREGRNRPQETIADVLHDVGFFDVGKLVALGRAWESLLERTRPDLVVCESAHNLALAARGRVPTIVIGTGYSAPPAGGDLPRLRFWERRPPSELSRRNAAAAHAALNAAAAKLGRTGFARLSDMFDADDVFVCCLPELDCYRAHRATPAIGSLGAARIEPATEDGSGLFAYLGGSPDLQAWFDGIAGSGLPAEAYIRGQPSGTAAPPASLTLHLTPVDLPQTLRTKSLIVHHGGMTTAETALRIGLPQVVIPRHLEQRMTAALLEASGIGIIVDRNHAGDPAKVAAAIRRAQTDPTIVSSARRLAHDVATRKARPALDIVVEACGRRL